MHADGMPAEKNRPIVRRSLKTQQRGNVEVDIVLGEPVSRTSKLINEPAAPPE